MILMARMPIRLTILFSLGCVNIMLDALKLPLSKAWSLQTPARAYLSLLLNKLIANASLSPSTIWAWGFACNLRFHRLLPCNSESESQNGTSSALSYATTKFRLSIPMTLHPVLGKQVRFASSFNVHLLPTMFVTYRLGIFMNGATSDRGPTPGHQIRAKGRCSYCEYE